MKAMNNTSHILHAKTIKQLLVLQWSPSKPLLSDKQTPGHILPLLYFTVQYESVAFIKFSIVIPSFVLHFIPQILCVLLQFGYSL